MMQQMPDMQRQGREGHEQFPSQKQMAPDNIAGGQISGPMGPGRGNRDMTGQSMMNLPSRGGDSVKIGKN